MMIIAIIPARGGSKGIPRKNIRIVGGEPLIAHSIEVANSTKYISRTIVSTDDEEIAKISREYGAEVPFIRPKNLAQDDSPTILALQHAVKTLESMNEKINVVVTLQPTSPLRTVEDLNNSILKILNTNCDSVISVTEVKEHPYLTFKIDQDRLYPFYGEDKLVRRQDLHKVYFVNGAIYVTKRDVLMEQNTLYGGLSRPYIMCKENSFQIDDPIDLHIVNCLFEKRARVGRVAE